MMTRLGMGLFGMVFVMLNAALLFGAAGRWDLPIFWAYVGICLAAVMHQVLTMDLELLQERVRPGSASRDNLALLRWVSVLLFAAHWVVAGLDVGRYHWSDTIPMGARIAGLIGMALAVALVRWAQTANRFFSAAVRIQRDRGHHVVTTGPYRYVRHPGYLAFMLSMLCSGLALGSWLALLIPLVFVPVFIRRTLIEDRMLQRELEGYAEYAAKVRYRLVPGLW